MNTALHTSEERRFTSPENYGRKWRGCAYFMFRKPRDGGRNGDSSGSQLCSENLDLGFLIERVGVALELNDALSEVCFFFFS